MSGYYDKDRNPNGYMGANATAQGTMGLPSPHLGNTAEYLVAGWPYTKDFTAGAASGDYTEAIAFQYVTQFITITAVGGNATVSIQGGDNFTVYSGTTQKFEVKAVDVSVTVSETDGFQLVAGLTNIPRSQYPSSFGTLATVESSVA